VAWANLISGFVGAIIGGTFALLAVWLQHHLSWRERRRNARYRLLCTLRDLQKMIGAEVTRVQTEHHTADDYEKRLNDIVLKMALNTTTRGLHDKILDILRENDGLPELQYVRRALWCPGAGAQKWLESISKAIKDLEMLVCPHLRRYEEELYQELPDDIRRAIEHPESLGIHPMSERKGRQ
jgi:hypothetical protein